MITFRSSCRIRLRLGLRSPFGTARKAYHTPVLPHYQFLLKAPLINHSETLGSGLATGGNSQAHLCNSLGTRDPGTAQDSQAQAPQGPLARLSESPGLPLRPSSKGFSPWCRENISSPELSLLAQQMTERPLANKDLPFTVTFHLNLSRKPHNFRAGSELNNNKIK